MTVAKSGAKGELAVATYNVHHWVGSDGMRDVGRCLDVLREIGASVAGLQEAGAPLWSLGDNAETLAVQTGMSAVLGPTLEKGESHFGNILLSAYPVTEVRRHDISLPDMEPRGVLDADLDVHGVRVRVLVTHFGLRGGERRRQARKFLDLLALKRRDATVLLGDFNEWFRLSRTLRIMRAELGTQPAPKTFPSFLPLFALDRIWVIPERRLHNVRTHSTPLSRMASDHLPLAATVSLE